MEKTPRRAQSRVLVCAQYPGDNTPTIISKPLIIPRKLKIIAYESLWHLVIPPVMTMLDDYEASRKVQGIKIVSEMLGKVPKDLLRRTGVDGLIFTVSAAQPCASTLDQESHRCSHSPYR